MFKIMNRNFNIILEGIRYMDYKDVLTMVLGIAFAIVIMKLFPNNPLSACGNYVKSLFRRKYKGFH
jgi:hypothetical protein